MNDLQISSYDYLAIFCPGLLLTFPLYEQLHDTFFHSDMLFCLVFLFISYFTGLLFHNILEIILRIIGILKNKYLLWCTYQHVNKETMVSENTKENIRQFYYKAYYSIMKVGMLGNIPILEAQEAFIRNFCAIAIVYLVFHKYYLMNVFSLCSCCACLICIIVILFSAMLWIIEQRKVFLSVWDAYNYCPKKNDDIMMRNSYSITIAHE